MVEGLLLTRNRPNNQVFFPQVKTLLGFRFEVLTLFPVLLPFLACAESDWWFCSLQILARVTCLSCNLNLMAGSNFVDMRSCCFLGVGNSNFSLFTPHQMQWPEVPQLEIMSPLSQSWVIRYQRTSLGPGRPGQVSPGQARPVMKCAFPNGFLGYNHPGTLAKSLVLFQVGSSKGIQHIGNNQIWQQEYSTKTWGIRIYLKNRSRQGYQLSL